MTSLRDKLARACAFNENDTFFAKPQLGEKDCARYENERLQPYLQLLGECVTFVASVANSVPDEPGSELWTLQADACELLAAIASAVGE